MLPQSVVVRAPAKVNLALACGPVRDDGYHELVTVFQAVGLYEDVRVERAEHDAEHDRVTVEGRQAQDVPLDGSNLALRAVGLLREEHDVPPLAVHVRKEVPVAGGMAGGSADAAATLLAVDHLLGLGLSRDALCAKAARLGADVPLGLVGGTAVGRGRGDELTPVLATGELHWVFAIAGQGLSTPAVFAEIDRLRPAAPAPVIDAELLAALRRGDAPAVGVLLRNDLEQAAVALRPDLADALAVGRAAGALGALVSGSGPTTAFLAVDHAGALDIAMALATSGVCADTVRACGPVPGARVISR